MDSHQFVHVHEFHINELVVSKRRRFLNCLEINFIGLILKLQLNQVVNFAGINFGLELLSCSLFLPLVLNLNLFSQPWTQHRILFGETIIDHPKMFSLWLDDLKPQGMLGNVSDFNVLPLFSVVEVEDELFGMEADSLFIERSELGVLDGTIG